MEDKQILNEWCKDCCHYDCEYCLSKTISPRKIKAPYGYEKSEIKRLKSSR